MAETSSGEGSAIKRDLIAGFLVFLIALPLCLGIAMASGFPPVAGVLTAIVGGVVVNFLGSARLTIKGPAAGLIVIAIGAVQELGGGDPVAGYRRALAVGVMAAAAQIVFALTGAASLGAAMSPSVVHGMLAAIGVIIMAKQIPVALGVSAKGDPLQLLMQIPDEFAHTNPAIGLIGAVSLATMFLWPLLRQPLLRRIPAPMVVVAISIPLGLYFGLDGDAPHAYTFSGKEYTLSRSFLVNVPSNLFGALTLPDFSGMTQTKGWYWASMFAIIGTLESLLSAKAVDMLDPWHRKTNLDRDDTAVGVGNLLASGVGGLPMISEIVRSRANIDNGARTRFANMFHGAFLLLFVGALPAVVSLIPLSALGAMLVYTGFRLAHPREFVHVYSIGREQLVVFTTTLVAVLTTDLLEGIAIGIGVKLLIHTLNGAPLRSLLEPHIEVSEREDGAVVLAVHHSAIFSNWIALRKRLNQARSCREVVLDLSAARLVDHTVMEKLHEMEQDFGRSDCRLVITGLELHRALSPHPFAARKLAGAS